MREDESRRRLARIYALRRLRSDLTARARFDAIVRQLRELIGESDDEPAWSVFAAAAQIAADLEQ